MGLDRNYTKILDSYIFFKFIIIFFHSVSLKYISQLLSEIVAFPKKANQFADSNIPASLHLVNPFTSMGGVLIGFT